MLKFVAVGFCLGCLGIAGAETVTLPSPSGHGALTLVVPPGYHVQNQMTRQLFLANGPAQLTVKWTPGIVKPPLLKAMRSNADQMRKQGKVVADISIGAYRGVMLRIPLNPSGVDLHAAMVSGQDLLSFSYFNPQLSSAKSGSASEMLKKFIATARIR